MNKPATLQTNQIQLPNPKSLESILRIASPYSLPSSTSHPQYYDPHTRTGMHIHQQKLPYPTRYPNTSNLTLRGEFLASVRTTVERDTHCFQERMWWGLDSVSLVMAEVKWGVKGSGLYSG